MKRYLFLAAAAALVVGVGVSYASVPDSSGLIHACYQLHSGGVPADLGRLRIIDPSRGQHCLSDEAALTWNNKGMRGASGPAGPRGASGPSGPRGASGPQGASGPSGPQGASGPSGPQGASGPSGPQGASGVNSPLVFGPYTNPSDADSGICADNNTSGNPGWATDSLSYTYVVSPQSDGSFVVTKMFTGTFVTTGSSSPNDCGISLTAGINGTMYGDEVFTIPAQGAGMSAAFDPMATCTSLCTGDDFVSAFFPGSTFPANYAWQFDYDTALSHWTNADYGNTGNITG